MQASAIWTEEMQEVFEMAAVRMAAGAKFGTKYLEDQFEWGALWRFEQSSL